jgi:uncharacterized membrane protein YbhN (UPF0104 family)
LSVFAAVNSFRQGNAAKFTAKIIIAGGIFYYIYDNINISEIGGALAGANYFLLSGALVLLIPNILIQYLKWKQICNELLEVQSNKKIFRSLLYGFSAGVITPGRVGEYFGRGIEFKGISVIQTSAAVLIDKLFPLLIMLFLGASGSIVFLLLHGNISIDSFIVLSIVIVMISILMIGIILSEKHLGIILSWRSKNNFLIKMREKLSLINKISARLTSKLMLLSFLFIVIYLFQFMLLLKGFAPSVSIINALVGGTLVMFIKTVIPTLTPGDIGVREGAAVFILGSLGESGAAAFSSAFFLFLINVLIPSLLGIFFMLRKKND